MAELQGEWLITKSIDEDGISGLREFDNQHAAIVIKRKLLTIEGLVQGDPFEIPMGMELKGSATPQAVDFLYDPNDKERPCLQLGIIECDNDRLRITCTCDCNPPESNRPTIFTSGARHSYLKHAGS